MKHPNIFRSKYGEFVLLRFGSVGQVVGSVTNVDGSHPGKRHTELLSTDSKDRRNRLLGSPDPLVGLFMNRWVVEDPETCATKETEFSKEGVEQRL